MTPASRRCLRSRTAAALTALVALGPAALPALTAPAAAAEPAPTRAGANGVVLTAQPYAFTDIRSTGTQVLAGVDDGATTVTSPFPLTLHDGTIGPRGVSVNSNGYVTVRPQAGGTIVVDPLQGNWQHAGAGPSSIRHQTIGTAGSRRLVVQWTGLNLVGASAAEQATFQLVFEEGRAGILLNLADTDVAGRSLQTYAVRNDAGIDRAVTWPTRATSGTSLRLDVTQPDSSGPDVTAAVTGTAGSAGWYTATPTVTWTTTDPQSPVLDRSGCDTTTVDRDTDATGITATCTAASGGGVTTRTVVLRRDAAAPTAASSVSPASPDGLKGWYVSAPTVSVACTDAQPGSGLASCGLDGTSTATRTLAEGSTEQAVTASATDVAGNASTTRTALRVDLADPVIACPTSPSVVYGSDPEPLVAPVSDGASGPVQDHVSRAMDSRALPGTHTLELTASDVAGRTATAECGYTVLPAPVTVTAPDVAAVYGQALPALEPSVTGLAAGDSLAGLTCTVAGRSAGTHDVTCTAPADPRYTVAHTAGRLTVQPAPLTVVAPSPAKTYGTETPDLAPEYVGLVAGDTASDLDAPAACTTTATRTSRTGSYAVTCAGTADRDYVVTAPPGTLTVSRADVVVTGPTVVRTYGDANPALTPAVTSLVGEDALDDLRCTSTATPASPVGSYPVTCTGTGDDYVVQHVPGTLVVQPAPLVVEAPDASRTYGDGNPALAPTYRGLVAGDTAADLTAPAVCTTTATATDGTGAYPVVCEAATSPDYRVVAAPGVLTITPARLTVTAPDATRTYGATDPALVPGVEGLVAGDTVADLTPITCASAAAVDAPVGTHPTTCTGGNTADYVVDHVAGTLTVTPAPLLVTGPTATRTHGDADPQLVPAFDGLVAGDTAEDVTATCAVDAPHVGTWPVTCTATSSDYAVTVRPGSLEVLPAPVTVTAPDATRTYGSTDPVLVPQVAGLVGGDTELPGLVCTSDATATSGVDSYATSCRGASAADYAVTYTRGTLSVTPALLTVLAPDATREEGDADPVLAARYAGLVAGDTVEGLDSRAFCRTSATTDSAPGSYPVTCTGAGDDDYVVTTVAGTLTVTPASSSPVITAPAQVRADATSRDGATVRFTATGVDGRDRPVAVTCSRPSGSTFPIGDTVVTCTADRAAAVRVVVHVAGAEEQLSALVTAVRGTHGGVPVKADAALSAVRSGKDAAGALATLRSHLQQQSGKSLTTTQAKVLVAVVDRVVGVVAR